MSVQAKAAGLASLRDEADQLSEELARLLGVPPEQAPGLTLVPPPGAADTNRSELEALRRRHAELERRLQTAEEDMRSTNEINAVFAANLDVAERIIRFYERQVVPMLQAVVSRYLRRVATLKAKGQNFEKVERRLGDELRTIGSMRPPSSYLPSVAPEPEALPDLSDVDLPALVASEQGQRAKDALVNLMSLARGFEPSLAPPPAPTAEQNSMAIPREPRKPTDMNIAVPLDMASSPDQPTVGRIMSVPPVASNRATPEEALSATGMANQAVDDDMVISNFVQAVHGIMVYFHGRRVPVRGVLNLDQTQRGELIEALTRLLSKQFDLGIPYDRAEIEKHWLATHVADLGTFVATLSEQTTRSQLKYLRLAELLDVLSRLGVVLDENGTFSTP